MTTRKQTIRGAFLLAAALALPVQPAGADDEGVRTGVVQEVDSGAGIVVIDGQRYRTGGLIVQPPPEVSKESPDYRQRPFSRGMIVRFTVKPGNPPGILRAWALDR